MDSSGLQESNTRIMDNHIQIPPTYCIYCREIGKRREVAQRHFTQQGVNVDFFEGVHGKTFKLRKTEACTVDGKRNDWFISPGHIGLCLSHWALWSHIWHAGHKEAIVLEDDAFFKTGFLEQFRKVYKSLPDDWDLVYLGWLHDHPRAKIKIKHNVYKLMEGCPFGTHAMLIRRSGIRKLLDTIRPSNAHIDVAISKHSLPHLNWYVVDPSIVTQRSQQGQQNKDKIWKPSV